MMTEENMVLDELMEEETGFAIKDDGIADWALRRIAEEEAEAERIIKIAQEQIQALQLKIDSIKEQTDRKTSFLKSHLQGYFRSVPHKETKTQESYKLLSGSLVMKKPTQKMVAKENLTEYLVKNAPEYIEPKAKWGDFKKNLQIVDGNVVDTTTGAVIDCVSVEDVPASFTIKL